MTSGTFLIISHSGFGSSSRVARLASSSLTVFSSSRSSWIWDATRTFLSGDDCRGDDEKDSFLFLLGVCGISAIAFLGDLLSVFDALVNAGPRRFRAGELSTFKACRLVLTLPALFAALRAERGVKNLLKERGVTGGGFFGLRRAPSSDTIEGGEDGTS